MSIRAKLMSLRGLWKGLHEDDLDPDPLAQFNRWYAAARRAGIFLPNSMMLATVSAAGRPSARMMLLKSADRDGFVFFTNYGSRKSEELLANPNAALVFHWNELMRQVRVEGTVQKASEAESRAYFDTRPRGSRIGAWASRQSAEIEGREPLATALRRYEGEFEQGTIPLPPFWGGFRLVPDRIEFWQGRPSRLHDRLCYLREGDTWRRFRLSP